MILSNCCEEWILRWGQHYEPGTYFICVPCGHSWRKDDRAFVDMLTSVAYQIVDVRGFRSMEPVGAPAPITKRCCSMILIEHGNKIQELPFGFQCPVCKTPWRVEQDPNLFRVRLYVNEETEIVFRLNDAAIPFLSVVAERAPVS